MITKERIAAKSSAAGSSGYPITALVAAMVLWGGSYVITRWALEGAGAFSVLAFRLVVASLVLMPFARRQGFQFRHVLDKRLIGFGVTGMVLHLGLEIVGLRFTSASSAALVIASAPAVTAVFSIVFLGERLTPPRWLGIAASMIGVVLVTGGVAPDGHPLGWFGNLLVFGGVLMWAVFTVQGKKIALDLPPLVTTTAATVSAAFLSVILSVVEISLSGAPTLGTKSVAAIVYLAVFAHAGAYGLWNYALRHVDASVAGPYINLVPVLGVAFGLLIGETLTLVQTIGGAVVALGIYLSYRYDDGARTARLPK